MLQEKSLETDESNQEKTSSIQVYEHLKVRKLHILKNISLKSLGKLLYCLDNQNRITDIDTSGIIKKLLNGPYPVAWPKALCMKDGKLNKKEGIACKKSNHVSHWENKCDKGGCKLLCESCLNVTMACCRKCESCLKCTLKDLSLNNWYELVHSRDICEILRLRLCIILLRIFRNFTSHITPNEWIQIDGSKIEDPDIQPICKSWEDIINTYRYTINCVIDYLKRNKCIDKEEDMEQVMEKVVKATQHSDLNEDSVKEYDQIIKSQNRIEGNTEKILSKTKEVQEDVKVIKEILGKGSVTNVVKNKGEIYSRYIIIINHWLL